MSFVYEMVGEENKELWKSLGWKNWGEKPLLFYKRDYWSRDKQRNIPSSPRDGKNTVRKKINWKNSIMRK